MTVVVVATAIAAWAMAPMLPAAAYTEHVSTAAKAPPWMSFDRNDSSPLRGVLTAYVNIGTKRYQISMRGGTGNGTKSECVTNRGQIPVGIYGYGDMDSASHLTFIANKTWGNEVVRGPVWDLGAKTCHPKSGEKKVKRTMLFIHSQGRSGWSGNYVSNGCIKVNQTDRARMALRWKSAYALSRSSLYVY